MANVKVNLLFSRNTESGTHKKAGRSPAFLMINPAYSEIS
jgi:hypothetical protein